MSALQNPNQQALLEQGREQVIAKDWPQALKSFKQAALACACTISRQSGETQRQKSLPICYCKDFASLPIDDGDRLTIYRLAKKPCTCGSDVRSCGSKHHVAALSCLSAAYGLVGDHKQAYRSASLLVIMAPHVPEGYYRMTKALMLKDPGDRLNTKNRCVWIMSQGTASVQTYGDSRHRLLKAFAAQTRRDILPRFPVEVQRMILANLSTIELCRALRVSKAWNYSCRDKHLWQRLEVIPRAPCKRARGYPTRLLANLATNLSQRYATSLTIKGLLNFAIDSSQLRSLLETLPRLQHLRLHGRAHRDSREKIGPDMLSSSCVLSAVLHGAPACLKTLHLQDFDDGHLAHPYIEGRDKHWPIQGPRFTASLEELTLLAVRCGREGCDFLNQSAWPKLEKLMMHKCVFASDTVPRVHTDIMLSTPNLKKLSTDEDFVYSLGLAWKPWPALEILDCNSFVGVANIPKTVRHLTLREPFEDLPLGLLNDYPVGQEPWEVVTGTFDRLEHLSLSYENADTLDRTSRIVEPLVARLKPSCDSGTLRSLHMTFNRDTRDAFDRVLNKAAINSLVCFDITVPSTYDSNGSYGGDTDIFVDWVREFPALDSLGIYTGRTGHGGMLVARVIRERPEIKRIHTNALQGVQYDNVFEYAEKKGVKIITSACVPEASIEIDGW
ncbi:hypothetical protein BD289DRAFT_431313 [Coniella lustricola]|uniref:F-box domain-containing protein n=1 Tax=Coniella lustricola TaxID=2025994 RepID=A0A2T3AAY1_9PEZI|nr:hypothetical protein BD289DRAFT_431313 [Coniella lustricola]